MQVSTSKGKRIVLRVETLISARHQQQDHVQCVIWCACLLLTLACTNLGTPALSKKRPSSLAPWPPLPFLSLLPLLFFVTLSLTPFSSLSFIC